MATIRGGGRVCKLQSIMDQAIFAVADVTTPSLTADEVLVRVEACGICGSDLHLYRLGMFEALGRPIDSGRIMGHELSGEVCVG